MEAVDFDPLTEEGREDLNNIADEEFVSLIPKKDETRESWDQRILSRFGSVKVLSYLKRRLADLFKTKNPGKVLPEYMELQNMDDTLDKQIVDILLTKYPDLDENLIEITVDEKGKQQISFFSKRLNDWTKPERLYKEDGTVRRSVETKIKSGNYKQITIQHEEIDARNKNLREEEQRNTEQINKNNEELQKEQEQ